MDEVLTSIDDIVVTATECAAHLPRQLSGHAFPEASNVVEGLVVDVPENHVIMMLMNDNLARVARALRAQLRGGCGSLLRDL